MSDICQYTNFSLIFDESTDISISQVLAIIVRYFDMKSLDVVDKLLDVVSVEDTTADGLYRAVKDVFTENNINISNVVGFGSDNCKHSLKNTKDGLGNSKYVLLSNFMTNLTILPHSSACVERIFSH